MPAARTKAASVAMDRIYRHQRFVYDLTRKYYLFGRDRLIADLAAGQGSVLEIGCGTGRNLVAVARRYPGAKVFGLDVSSAMLETAQAAIARRGLMGRVRTVLADATTFVAETDLGVHDFDRVFMSYTLSMIPDWRAALERAAACLAPGGRLLIVDFGQLEGYPSWAKRLLFGWLRLFHVRPIRELPAAVADLAWRMDLVLHWHSLLRGYAVYAVLQRP